MGIWGRGLIPWNLRDSPTVDEALRLKLQHRLVLELLVDSFTGSKTETIENIFGKRTPTATRIHQYIKKHPKNDVFLFSSVGEDKVLDAVKKLKRFKIYDADFVNEEFSVEDFKDTLLIFDDVDCISDKRVLKKVYEILDKALVTGRHSGTSVVYTTHTACNGSKTKLILTESHSITFFMNGMNGRSSKYLLDGYLGLDKKQIQELKKIKSRWTTVIKSFPQLILTQRQLIFSKDL